MVQEMILALRKNQADPEIVYTLGLRTTAARYSLDGKVLNELLKTFKLPPPAHP